MYSKLIEEYIPERFKSIEDFWQHAYPADFADLLMNLSSEELNNIIDRFSSRELGEIISYLDYETSNYIARYFSETVLSDILTRMHTDDAVDFLGTMPVGKVKKILNNMKDNKAIELQQLLGYDEESAGGLMNTEYVAFYSDNTTQKVLEKLRDLSPEPEMIYYIYVISRTKELVGVLSVRQLLGVRRDVQLHEIMADDIIKVGINKDQEEVADVLSKYDLLAVPVVNKQGQLMGIITVDDVIDVIEDEATEDFYKLAATSNVYNVDGGILAVVKKRIPWLLLLLVGDLISGSVIKGFEASLQTVVALAFFIPVLMDMGGNVGTQSLTVVVRGLATGELHFNKFLSHLWQEIKVGLIMAIVLGTALSLVVLIWQGNPVLGFIVGVSMFSTLLTAIIVGTSIPFLMEALGADPAVAAGPFITTIVDISGLFIYFSMATILMKNLL